MQIPAVVRHHSVGWEDSGRPQANPHLFLVERFLTLKQMSGVSDRDILHSLEADSDVVPPRAAPEETRMRSVQSAMLLMVLVVVGLANSAPLIVTYQDYLNAFPQQGNSIVIPDESLETVRQIALEVLYTYSRLRPGDPDRLCIPPNVHPDRVIPGYWAVRLNDTVRFDTKAGRPPAPSDRIRDMLLSMFKRSLDYCCPGPRPVHPRSR